MISERARGVRPFLVMEILEEAQALERKGADVVHLEIGEPDFDTPKHICDSAKKALDCCDTHYTHSLGKFDLREAICRWHQKRYGVNFLCERVIVTSGTSPALLLALASLCDRDDEVIISNPYYACYPNFCRVLGINIKFVSTSEKDGFLFDPDKVKRAATSRTRAIVINSPSNPTGQILDDERLKALCELGMFVVSDEIYHGLEYGVRAETALKFTDSAVVINGFSKLFAMTGWRLGYAIAPKRVIRAMQKLQQNLFISASAFGQTAAIAALEKSDRFIKHVVSEYDRRRKALISGLQALGFGIAKEPKGAFYVLANAIHIDRNSKRLAKQILKEAHVAVTPGIDFGSRAEGFLRFSYATSVPQIEEGLKRLKKFLRRAGSCRLG